jgi:predicted amidohydrolase YtcJ
MTALIGLSLTVGIYLPEPSTLPDLGSTWIPALLALFAGGLLSIWGLGGASKIRRDGSNPADLAVMNARIFTSDDDNPWAEAVAVKDERITYVGDNEGIADYVGPNTRVIDARKNMMVPGFIDNHCHHLWIGAINAFMPLLYEAKSVDGVKEIIRDFAAEHPDYPFIMGVGWMYDYIPGRFPTKEMADEILDDRPLLMMSYGGESGWLNSLAFERVKRYPDVLKQFPLHVDETGKETGVLFKFYAVNPFDFYDEGELPDNLKEPMFAAMTDNINEALKFGITTINDVQLYKRFIPDLLEFRDRGLLNGIRARGSYYISHVALEDEDNLINELKEWKELGEKSSDDRLNLGESVKIYIEGVSVNYTSLMLEPYADKPGEYGEALWTQEDFDRVMEIVDGMGLQACTHACGDGGVRRVINGYERIIKANSARDARHRVDHCELITAEDMKRMAELELYAAMQPCQFYGDETTESVLGDERLRRRQPWRSLEKAGVNVSFGSDWCAGPMNPIYGFLVAGLRLNYHLNDEWGADEKVSVENIIKHYTIDSAKALHMEDDIGSIEVGKFGDFVLFSIDLFDLTSWWFLLTHDLELGAMDDFVLFTVSGGEIVYHKEGEKF